MPTRFLSFVYWHDRIFGFTDIGDCWEFMPPDAGGPTWRFVSYGPVRVPTMPPSLIIHTHPDGYLIGGFPDGHTEVVNAEDVIKRLRELS